MTAAFQRSTNPELNRHLYDPDPHNLSEITASIPGDEDIETIVDQGIAAHVALSDPHAQYVSTSDLQDHIAASNPHGVTAAQVGADPAGTAALAVAEHEADASAHAAADITFDGAASGLAATDVQAAIDESEGRIEDLETAAFDTHQPGGMVQTNEDSTLTKVDGTRTLTVAPTGVDYSFYVRGDKFTKTGSDNVVWGNTEGIHFFAFDNTGTLITEHESAFADEDELEQWILFDNSYLAALYWDATNSKSLLLEERHGASMSPVTHQYLHRTRGSQYLSGSTPGDIVADATGNLDAHAQFSVTQGVMVDEDLYSTIAAKAATGDLTVLYKDGATGTWRWVEDSAGVVTTGTGRAAWNESVVGTWQLTEVSNNSFVCAHLFQIPILESPAGTGYAVIVGQAEYANIVTARESAPTELSQLVFDGLPTPEFVPVATFIHQTSNVYSNTWKSRIRTNDEGDDYIDWRATATISSAGTSSDHGSLAGLLDDDHQQYAKLIGRSGDTLNIEEVQALTSAGLSLQSSAGTQCLLLGAGGGQNATFQDGVNVLVGQFAANNVLITGGSITDITDIAVADGGTGASTPLGARANLGLAIGSDVQAWAAALDDLSDSAASGFTFTTTTVNGVSLTAAGSATQYLDGAGNYDTINAVEVAYSNVDSTLTAADVKAAIDELDTEKLSASVGIDGGSFADTYVAPSLILNGGTW